MDSKPLKEVQPHSNQRHANTGTFFLCRKAIFFKMVVFSMGKDV